MSIDKVEVTNERGALLILSLQDISNGYVIEEIGGMGPVKATIVSSDFATLDGQQYQASSREVRNITMKIGFAPDYTQDQNVLDLRLGLYDHFMTDTEVDLAFYMTNGMVVNTRGRVETCEPSIFTREPQVDISIVCFDPDFVDLTPVSIHDVLTTDDTSGNVIMVAGSGKTGLTSLTFTAPQALTDFSIYHTTPSGQLRTMLVSAPLQAGDVVTLCTIPGQKSITLNRGGSTSSLLWAVSPQSEWVLLEKGENLLHLNTAPPGPGAFVLVDFHNRYGGL